VPLVPAFPGRTPRIFSFASAWWACAHSLSMKMHTTDVLGRFRTNDFHAGLVTSGFSPRLHEMTDGLADSSF
jgi:hypothetical protein